MDMYILPVYILYWGTPNTYTSFSSTQLRLHPPVSVQKKKDFSNGNLRNPLVTTHFIVHTS